MANGFQQNTNQPSGQFSGGGDFSGSLNDILAPYQQMAQQFQSPYATMKPNSWLAQNHPQIAGVLDNAFLGGAMTPGPQGPEGVGGGISRAMQGMVGTQQFRRQQMMQNAMLPMQMAGPALQMADTLSQIHERNAMIPFRQSQELRNEAYYDKMLQGNRPQFERGQTRVDDKGQEWNTVFDPTTGKASLQHAVTGQDANALPEDQRPSFTNERRNQTRALPGGLAGEIIDMRMSSDPAIRARGEQMSGMYTGMMGGLAGARTGAEQALTQPPKDTATFVKQERQAAYGMLPKIQSANDFQSSNIADANYWKDPQKAYEGYVKTQQAAKQTMDIDLSKYEKSSAPRMGVSFQEYMQNRTQWDGSAPNPAPAKTASPTSNQPTVNKNWTYGQ